MNTVSKEIGQALQKKGIVTESYFSWVAVYLSHKHNDPCAFEVHAPIGGRKQGFTYRTFYPAPTVGELMELLPRELGYYYELRIGKDVDGSAWVSYEYHGDTAKLFQDHNPADALAEMLLWLKKEGQLG